MAKNQEAALKKGQAFYENMEDYRTRWQSLKPEWDQIEFVKGGVAEDRGCDC